MKMQIAKDWKQRLMLAGAMAFLSPAALSAEAIRASKMDVITVTAPRVVAEVRRTRIEFDLARLIDSIEKQIANDQARDLEAIGTRRIELAIIELPTRG